MEKTSSTDETLYLLLLDTSKAFNSIQRGTLIEDLKNVLNQYKLHLIQIMLDDPTGIIVGETVNYLVAHQIQKMTLKEKTYLQ